MPIAFPSVAYTRLYSGKVVAGDVVFFSCVRKHIHGLMLRCFLFEYFLGKLNGIDLVT